MAKCQADASKVASSLLVEEKAVMCSQINTLHVRNVQSNVWHRNIGCLLDLSQHWINQISSLYIFIDSTNIQNNCIFHLGTLVFRYQAVRTQALVLLVSWAWVRVPVMPLLCLPCWPKIPTCNHKCDPICENESDVDNLKNWIICMAGKNTPAAVIWYLSWSFGVYRVAELLLFEIGQYHIFC